MKCVRLIITLAATVTASCVTTKGQSDLVVRRATFDLQCPDKDLQVSSLGQNTFGVVGCGRRATYVVDCKKDYIDSCTAVMNTAEKPTTAEGSK
jgi:hypothetical protein